MAIAESQFLSQQIKILPAVYRDNSNNLLSSKLDQAFKLPRIKSSFKQPCSTPSLIWKGHLEMFSKKQGGIKSHKIPEDMNSGSYESNFPYYGGDHLKRVPYVRSSFIQQQLFWSIDMVCVCLFVILNLVILSIM